MIYAILAALFAVGAIGFGAYEIVTGYGDRREHEGEAKYKAAYEAADKQLADASAAAVNAANETIASNVASFNAGEAKSKGSVQIRYVKAQGDVTKYPVFSNPACVLPPEALANLNAARAAMRTGNDVAQAPAAANTAPLAPRPAPVGHPLPAAAPTPAVGGLKPVTPKGK